MALSACTDCATGLWMLLTPPPSRSSGIAGRCLVVHSAEQFVSENYEVGEVLGQGGFGTVSLARDRQCGRDCLLKVIDRDAVPDAAKLDTEVEIHAALDHPNIVRIYETFLKESQLSIVMELCRGGELCDAVEKKGAPCSEGEARHIFGQVMHAVNYMHCQGFAHRDLKLENFLVKEPEVSLSQCTIKLIDFGLAGRFQAGRLSLVTVCGTPDYMAPEVFGKAAYSEKCDVWSCGVILYTLLSGDMPFSGGSVDELIQNLKTKPILFQPSAWKSVSKGAQNLVRRSCCKAVARRLSARQVLSDAWLKAHEVDAEEPVAEKITSEMLANAEEFGEMTALQRASLHRVAYNLDDEQVGGMREAFLRLDSDDDGKITKEELLQGADQAGVPAQECAHMAELFDQLDSDRSGVLEYTEFLAGMLCHRSKMSTEACKAAFRCIDTDGSGAISVQEIQRILAQDNAGKMSAEGLEKTLQSLGIDGDGDICFEDFVEMLNCSGSSAHLLSAAPCGGA